MKWYCDKQIPLAVPQVPAFSSKPQPGYIKAMSKYRLKGKPNPVVGQSRSTEEEEFSRYKTGSLSLPDTDLIQFWEVCVWNHCDVLFTLFDSNSYIKRNILDYMPLHWITSPFRHHLFHVSTSSHQPAKWIWRNRTDFHPNWWRPSKCWNSSTRRNSSVSHISSHPLLNALCWTTLLNLEICSMQIRRLRWRQQTACSVFVH